MSKKKGFLKKLFAGPSGGCSCGIEVTEEKPQKSGCCNMQIVEEMEAEQCCCCDSENNTDKNKEIK